MTDPLMESDAWRRGVAQAKAEAAAAAEQTQDEQPAEQAKKLAPLPPVDVSLDPAKHWTNWGAAVEAALNDKAEA